MKWLFICTHNRCRSILAEAITHRIAAPHIQAYSAGSHPAGEVHPLSLRYLAEQGYDTRHLRSQSWDDFQAVQPDVVITVCDSAAKETCPLWFGNTIQIHWGLADPSKIKGDEHMIKRAFRQTMSTIEKRIQTVVDKQLYALEGEQLRAALNALGEIK